jgi:peptidoglycan-associated lipoprotein
MKRFVQCLLPVLTMVAMVSFSGCKHNIAPQPVATAPSAQAPAPTAKISVSPTYVSAGTPVVVTWHTANAARATIDGIGDVATSGTKTVTPSVSTNYHLVASGAGGTAFDDARVTVTAPPTQTAAMPATDELADFRAHVKDIFFDYDKYAMRNDAERTITHDAAYLTSHPGLKIVIGGYCDERGSDEYNLALGQNRASYTKNALVADGIAASRIRVISYGKEKQFCSQLTDDCYQQNRRADFVLDQ